MSEIQKKSYREGNRKMPHSIFKKGHIPWHAGKKNVFSEETNKKRVESRKWYKYSKEAREKMSKSRKGIKFSDEHLKNLSLSHIGNKHTKEQTEKIIKSRKWYKHSKKTIEKISKKLLGHKISKQTKIKIRNTTIKNLKKRLEGVSVPLAGFKEKCILDNLEEKYNIKILRQYPVNGYFLDGYCKETNTAYEVDEKHHFNYLGKLRIKDIERQKEIEEELNCDFIRIKDWEWLNGNQTKYF